MRQPGISAGSGHPCIPALCRFRQGWQYRVLCRGLWRTRCRPVVRQPDISAGKLGIPVFLHCAGSGTRAVPCSLPEFEVLPVILPGLAAPIMPPGLSVRPQCAFARHVGQYRFLCLGLWCCLSFCPDLWVSTGYSVLVYVHTLPPGRAATGYFGGQLDIPVSLRCAGSGRGGSTVFSAGACGARAAARSCGYRRFRRAVGHPCILVLCRFRQGWQYRVLCRGCGAHYAARAFRPPAVCLCPPCGAAPCSLLGLAAPIMPPGTVAFFPGKSSLIFRQTRKLYTGSLRNCLPALNRLFFCMSHSLLCDELLHTHLV